MLTENTTATSPIAGEQESANDPRWSNVKALLSNFNRALQTNADTVAAVKDELTERQNTMARNHLQVMQDVQQLKGANLHHEATIAGLVTVIQELMETFLPDVLATTVLSAQPAPLRTKNPELVAAARSAAAVAVELEALPAPASRVALSGKAVRQSLCLDKAVLDDLKGKHKNLNAYFKRLLVEDNPNYVALLETVRERD